jgi:hypothetical protein
MGATMSLQSDRGVREGGMRDGRIIFSTPLNPRGPPGGRFVTLGIDWPPTLTFFFDISIFILFLWLLRLTLMTPLVSSFITHILAYTHFAWFPDS